jgi:cell division septal protein FtsQ
MARKSRRRLIGIGPRLGRALAAGLQSAIRHPQLLILSGVLLMAGWALWDHARRTDAFRITQVLLPSDSSLTLREPILNTNLWDLDIHALARELKQQQPWLKEVRVIRQLPNAIRVEAIPRIPLAQVRAGRCHPVDQEGFLLPPGSGVASEDLVRFSGTGPALSIGKANTDERLLLALRILQKLRRNPVLVSRRLTEINVADPQQIRFVVDGELEVRCGSEPELDAHLSRLRASLRAVSQQPMSVRYIDLRFKEPVVGPRT